MVHFVRKPLYYFVP